MCWALIREYSYGTGAVFCIYVHFVQGVLQYINTENKLGRVIQGQVSEHNMHDLSTLNDLHC